MNNRHFFKKLYAKGVKCKVLFTLLFLVLLFSSFVNKAMAAVQGYPYVTFDATTGTLTLAYGDVPTTGKNVSAQFSSGSSVSKYVGDPLITDATQIKHVVIKSSFASFEPDALQRMFEGCTNLETIEGLEYINTVKVKKLSNMFYNCKKLTSISFGSNFTTDKVTSMDMMFMGCESLTELDLSTFSSEALTSMSYMFAGNYECSPCKELTSIKFGDNFTIESVKTLQCTFEGCEKLTNLDISKFTPTTALTNMGSTFSGCKALTKLDLSNFNTSKVTTMQSLFFECENLTTLILGTNFTTDEVLNMTAMFGYCKALISLDLKKFNTTKVTDMSGMFNNCESLETIQFGSNFITASVQSMKTMFNTCLKLESLDLSSFDTKKVTNMERMFQKCQTLEHLDLSKFNTDNVANMSSMFAGCSNLLTLDISNFTTTKITTIGAMFYQCSKLTTIRCNNTWNLNKNLNKTNLFGLITEILGNEGTPYNVAQQHASEYAKVDKITSSSIPGYFTTGKYKIFYDLYGGEVTSGTNPTEFDENSAKLHIINPEKEGYLKSATYRV